MTSGRAAAGGRGGRAGPGGPGRRCSREMYERARSDLPDEDPDRDVRRPGGAAGHHVQRRRGPARGPDAGVRRGGRARCWTRWPPRPEPRTTGPRSSGTTTRWPRPCAGWSPPACCRSGPGSRSRPGRTSRWPTCSCWTASSALQEEWTAQVRARWAARRAAASETGSDGGAWLDGDAAEAIACDAAMAPIVTGDVNVDALEDLVRLCVELDARRRDGDAGTRPGPRSSRRSSARPSTCCPARAGWRRFLRRRQLGARLGGPSLPLDIGYAETVPAGIRNAVMLRDQHCQWAGGCDQPAGGLPGAPHQAQGQRRHDLASRTACCCARSTTRS